MAQHTWEDMQWLNPPRSHCVDHDGTLHAQSGDKTDFWQGTYYNFYRDDGHALLKKQSGNFTAEGVVDATFSQLYDQVGLMLRLSPTHWIKFGVEIADDAAQLSCVVTNGQSDWSAFPAPMTGPFSLRMTRLGASVLCEYEALGRWHMARLAPLGNAEDDIWAGVYFCAPERDGFQAQFRRFSCSEPAVTQLHQ